VNASYNGTENVTVYIDPQDSGGSNSEQFTVLPSVISTVPTSGAVGAPVQIFGTALLPLSGSPTVTFNGVAATVGVTQGGCGNEYLDTTVPTGATSGNVVVSGVGGTSNAVPFTVN
jgi:hypothetical protein